MASKTTQAVAAAAAAAAMALAMGCSPDPSSKASRSSAEPQTPHPRAMAHKYKQNPNQKQRYDITLTIVDAPGPFESVEGFAQYAAPDCVFVLDRFAGVTSNPEYRMPIAFRKVDESTYVGTVYLDAMLDQDYFGKGICHWQFTNTTAVLKATGAEAEAGFAPSLGRDMVLAKKPKTKYFWKEYYPQEEGYDDFPVFGDENIMRAPPDRRDEFFTITLVAMEAKP